MHLVIMRIIKRNVNLDRLVKAIKIGIPYFGVPVSNGPALAFPMDRVRRWFKVSNTIDSCEIRHKRVLRQGNGCYTPVLELRSGRNVTRVLAIQLLHNHRSDIRKWRDSQRDKLVKKQSTGWKREAIQVETEHEGFRIEGYQYRRGPFVIKQKKLYSAVTGECLYSGPSWNKATDGQLKKAADILVSTGIDWSLSSEEIKSNYQAEIAKTRHDLEKIIRAA